MLDPVVEIKTGWVQLGGGRGVVKVDGAEQCTLVLGKDPKLVVTHSVALGEEELHAKSRLNYTSSYAKGPRHHGLRRPDALLN